MPRFDPASHPGRPAPGPVLVLQGRTWQLAVDGTTDAPVRAVDEVAAGAPVLEPGAVRWVVAHAATADPDRLVDLLLDGRGAIVLPAWLADHRRVWEARVAPAGNLPLALDPAPGVTLATHVLGVHVDDLQLLDASEGRGERTVLGRVGPVAVAGRFLLPDALAHAPSADTRLLTRGDGVAVHPAVTHEGARALLAAGAVTVAASPPPAVHHGPWPATPLADLPLFVYGTLQPGHSRYPHVADLVAVAGPARTAGGVTATFYGYPALDTTAPGTVHGTLLVPRSAGAAAELVALADELEDAPSLFARTTVRVRTPGGGWQWAMTYEWNHAQGPAPGTPVPDGRWVA
ncbi:MAG: gamma-glutamylcyclotransferase [Actinomycetes bacterium]